MQVNKLWKNAKKPVRRSTLASLLGEDPCSISIIEFGAFASPTYEKTEADVFYADRLSTGELKSSVGNPSKRDAVVSVDYVIGTEFDTTIGRTFDLVIANHVVEHVPDVIGWLNRLSRLLTADGHVFLSVPDKNYTFDIIRDPTLVRELISNFESGKDRPSVADIFDAKYFRRDIKLGSDVWSGEAHKIISKKNNMNVTDELNTIRSSFEAGNYMDTHCNVFTEMSFTSVFKSLDEMGIGDLKLVETRPVKSPYNEFYALFQKK